MIDTTKIRKEQPYLSTDHKLIMRLCDELDQARADVKEVRRAIRRGDFDEQKFLAETDREEYR